MNSNPKIIMKLLVVSLAVILSLPIASAAAIGEPQASSAKTAQADQWVPLRSIVETLGGEVLWDEKTATITVKRLEHAFEVQLGSTAATVDDKESRLSAIPQLIQDHTYIPLLFLNQALDTEVGWDNQQNQIILEQSDITNKATVFIQTVLNDTKMDPTQYFSALLKSSTPLIGLKQNYSVLTKTFGAFKGITTLNIDKNAVHNNVHLTLAFDKSMIPFTIRFNQSGEIDDFLVDASPKTAGYQTPSYANPQAYTEKEVVINEGRWALPGTLTLPTGQGMHPVVVLVHGSGPDDRDESFYALKPFRDLASGLASQGIAVLRYEKRSLEYPVQLSSNPKITIKEEAQDDAQAAISLLSKMEGIDPNRIYVLGHSQGGFMMPRLLAADTHKQIAGTILMSAPSGTLSALIEKQYGYLVSLKQAPQQTLDYFKAQFALLNDPGFSPDHPPQGFTLPSMYWWNDLRNYEPAQTAKLQTGKMLVLQGGRDYQVTADNLDIWKDALKERTDVVYHLYPKLNHFYTEGEGGLSTPAEYLTPGNIPAYVINDIVHWVNQ